MRFHCSHRFVGSADEVMTILADPDFYLGLELPDLSDPILIDSGDDPDEHIRLRYEFTGAVDPIAQRLIGSERLTWLQTVRIDRSRGLGSLEFESERQPKLLHGSADFTVADDGGAAIRQLDGELVVSVPGIGRMAERRIVPGVIRRLDIEAQAVNARLYQ